MEAVAADPVAVTVIVAVRLIPEAPAVNVNVALPVASVVNVDALICPVVAAMVRACAASIELLEFKTVAVSVTELVPSLLTLVPVEVRAIVAAVDVVVAVVVVAVGATLPQPEDASIEANAKIPIKIIDVRLIKSIVNFLFRAYAQSLSLHTTTKVFSTQYVSEAC